LTSLVAGLSTIAELDLKKLVALSTLRHLGFIGIRIFRGSTRLAFLHLFSHALFKSLLFVSVGGIIMVMGHSQDARLLSFSRKFAPFSSSLLVISRLSLLGLPFTRGFYSKDFILESFYFSSISSPFLFLAYLNVALRFFYSLKIIFFNRNFPCGGPFIILSPVVPSFLLIILFISLLSVCFCPIYLYLLGSFPFLLMIPPLFKLLPFIVLIASIVLLIFVLSTNKILILPLNFTPSLAFFLFKISFLSTAVGCLAPPTVNFRVSILKPLEIGYLSFLASSSSMTLNMFKHLSINFIVLFTKLPFSVLILISVLLTFYLISAVFYF